MKPSRRLWIPAALVLLAAAACGWLLRERLWLASLYLSGKSPHCSFASAVGTLAHERSLTEVKDRILASSSLLETDAQGFRHWRTPKGDYWIPPGQDWGLPFNLSEQENKIYGAGSRAVQPGDLVLDCGANVGVFAREALAQGARLVVAIEPAPENLECLRRNLAREAESGRVLIYEKGVWDKDDFLVMNVAPDNPAADSFVLTPQGSKPGMRLPLTTIDKLVAELKLDRVDYIKMDIEGAEQNALKGARETLRRFRPRLSLSSYHRPDDPERIPVLVREAWEGYRMECGPCTYAGGILRPDVLYFY